MNEPISSAKVLEWPEFQDLAKRLQVDVTQRIIRLVASEKTYTNSSY